MLHFILKYPGYNLRKSIIFYCNTLLHGPGLSLNGHDTICVDFAGHFLFIEASGKNSNQKAVIYSPFYQSLGHLCVGFYYHMFGRQTGTLNVYTKVSYSTDINLQWHCLFLTTTSKDVFV